MKRLILISTVLIALAWIFYSSYELWLNKDNTIQPEFVFNQADESIFLINKYDETKAANYIEIIHENPLSSFLYDLDSLLTFNDFKIYASGNRPIVIFEKDSKWEESEKEEIKNLFALEGLTFNQIGYYFMIAKDYKPSENYLPANILLERDKNASANYWENLGDQWKRTDIYSLSKGLFEYRSSLPNSIYGPAVRDIPTFSSQIPTSSTSYFFQERFYAAEQDSVFKNGPMEQWVDKGFVTIEYEGNTVIISDYRPQQIPSLILIEQTEVEDSIQVLEDLHSFSGFQLTSHFPSQKNGRFYCFEIEDKFLFTESQHIARKIQVDYQLGRTLSLSPERQNQFFAGLPSHVNMRNISMDKKASLTWKNNLAFEVNTQPPSRQLQSKEELTWSISPKHNTHKLIPIPDHLRQGTSVLSYSSNGKYELIGPNGKLIWSGDIGSPIENEVEVIDLFDNDKHQFLFHTQNKIYLIDLNGNHVGSFPYESEHELTSGTSVFEWSNTKRLLTGNERGEIIMLNSSGQELNIIRTGNKPIISTPYALNVKGNLRAWSINSDFQQYLGYLESPATANQLSQTEVEKAIKFEGKVILYYEKEGKVYAQEFISRNNQLQEAVLIDNGELFKVTNDYIVIRENNYYKVLNHKHNIVFSKQLSFNEVGEFIYHPDKKNIVVFDYLQNKIHAYSNTGEEILGFPKEGRNSTTSYYNKKDRTLYTYTVISQSIICYKTKF